MTSRVLIAFANVKQPGWEAHCSANARGSGMSSETTKSRIRLGRQRCALAKSVDLHQGHFGHIPPTDFTVSPLGTVTRPDRIHLFLLACLPHQSRSRFGFRYDWLFD
jgi:hypothetical protein